GFVSMFRRPPKPVLWAWFGAVLFYSFVAARGVRDGHYQYLLPIMPVVCIVAGKGLSLLFDAFRRIPPLNRRPPFVTAGTIFLALLFAAKAAWAAHRFETRDLVYFGTSWHKMKTTGEIVKRITAPGSLLIVVDEEMDELTPTTCMTPPEVFYFGDR